MHKPRAILFDWDNTLVDTWPTIHEALNHTLRAMNHPEWSLEQVKAQVKKSMRDAFPSLFGDAWEEASQIYQTYYRRIHLNDLQPLEGALDVVKLVHESDAFFGVVSNKRGPNLRTEIEHLKWTDYFDVIVGADDAAFDKPHSAPVTMALDGSGIAAGADVWFVGDTVIDLECAKNTGCVPILYGDVMTQNGVYDGFEFVHHAKDHGELLSLLKSALHLSHGERSK